MVSGGPAFWQTMAINYVGSSSLPVGKVWLNTYAQSGLNGKLH
ncbi:DUF3047 domain-containing protein [Methylicorpusculum oleiharenae]|nr:DUF3047 domain-containing protein [Methylicorpusculum oleiharenae]